MEHPKVVITGGTGLVGRAVSEHLSLLGYHLIVPTRNPDRPSPEGVTLTTWDGVSADQLVDVIRGAKAVVHLAGENVGQRWTPSARKAILDSRVQGSKALAKALEALPPSERPFVIAASAIGFYGHSMEVQDETAEKGEGFLSDVTASWEAELADIETRKVTLRLGMVLSTEGGALARLIPLFRLGLGAPVGTGAQWQSWIHIQDAARLIVYCLVHEVISGPLNAVAPEATTNRDFSNAMAKAMNVPFWAPAVPGWALRLILGEMASMALDSMRIESRNLSQIGFKFSFPTIDHAMANLFAK